ncbi:hypothetical protein Mgra_00003667 [Meloidogyne graminicola]|uniref:Uncharacterized protein n=1 Tax=Meloidogyne graminicola TaxID=189291 RepID=A0A8S9ZUP9_9BILA|nr:hypothetical protein Mgra_00003667 [Meloidogyne graminicola]
MLLNRTNTEMTQGKNVFTSESNPEQTASLDEPDTLQHSQSDTFICYKPPRLRCGFEHPDEVVETLSLSSVSSPEIRYTLAIPDELTDAGKISGLQLEAVLYACQAHERFLPSGERCGYLIGDGAGVGKGRTIATIIFENYLRGRRKSIWVSVSSDLKFDAERDMRDIGASKIPINALNKMKYSRINHPDNGLINKGIIFATYSSLIGESRIDGQKGSECHTRLKQIVQWCGRDFDGVIVFDECHRAKNLCPSAGTRSTKTGRVVLELQQALPTARIVYASATGATEPRNMAYMTRLGLWGLGLTFGTFGEFIHSVENRGVGAMEMVAMDIKLRGLYLSRQLSFRGADFYVEEIPLTKDFIKIYDESAKLWMECRRQFAKALNQIPDSKAGRQNIWARFWGAHQRFFKYLCISAKVDSCVRIALQAIKNGKCVVIGLQSTGESHILDFLEENGEVTEFVSTAKSVLQSLVENHFPTHNDSSAIDDFQRMFLCGSKHRKRKRNSTFNTEEDYLDEYGHKRLKNGLSLLQSDLSKKLTAERESGGNSEFETYSGEEEEDNYSEVNTSSYSSGGEETDEEENSEFSETDDDVGSDEEELERLVCSDKSKKSTKKASNDEEINPFLIKNILKDPWADVQGTSEDTTPLPEIEKVPQKKKKSKKNKKIVECSIKKHLPLIKPVISNVTCNETAEEFVSSLNGIGDTCEDDDGSVNLTEIKTNLLAAIERLGKLLPPNTLDSLINLLGGPKYVAELTGRRGRVVAKIETGDVEYELRTADSEISLEMMNVVEKDKFMRGEKLVAIISEAASSGISLQSDKRAPNRRRRVHITLELPWSADKAIQQFGRTHRSNQQSAPEYLFLISELAGEKRFASIVAKRLESLGALTQGDRRATESRDLSQFNIDNTYGREALNVLLRTLTGACQPIVPPPKDYDSGGDFFKDMQIYLEGVGMICSLPNGGYAVERDSNSIPKFLNRLLGFPVYAQNKLFQYFNDICEELIKQAKVDGTFDMGILDLGMECDRVQKKESRKFKGTGKSGDFTVELHKISLLRSVSWEEVLQLSKKHKGYKDGFYTSTVGLHGKRSVAFIFGMGVGGNMSTTSTGAPRLYCVTRPNTGRSPKYELINELMQRFEPISKEEGEELWKEQLEAFSKMCHHRYYFGKCSAEQRGVFCEVGRQSRTYFVLSGSLICVWPELELILSDSGKLKRLRRIQIVRVKTDNNQRIVGVLVLPNYVQKLVHLLEERCNSSNNSAGNNNNRIQGRN